MLIENRDRKLLRAIGLYQRHRHRRDPLSRLKCGWGKLGHVWWSLLSGCDISRDAQIAPDTRFPHPGGIVIHARAVIEPGCLIMQQVTLGQLDTGGAPRSRCYPSEEVASGRGRSTGWVSRPSLVGVLPGTPRPALGEKLLFF